MHETWVEIWTRPGAATFEPIAADPDATNWSATVRLNGVGEGVLQVPDDWDYFDDVFYQDPDDPSLSRRSLVRLFNSAQPDVPFYEWIIDAATPPEQQETAWQIDGPGIEAIVGEVILEPFDWDGSDQFASFFPDHVYGGENLLGDLRGRYEPGVFRVVDNGNTDGGTFKISVVNSVGGTTQTGNIPYDANPTQVYNEVILLDTVDELEVSGEAGDLRLQVTKPELNHVFGTNSVGLVSVRNLNIQSTVTAGTYTLTIDGATTGPIAYNADAATVEAAIEALGTVTDATVDGNPYGGIAQISFVTPDTISTFTADFALLVDGTGSLTVPGAFYEAITEQGGGTEPIGWTSSEFSPTDIQHGTLLELRMWETGDPALPAGADTAIMFNGTEPYYPGIQRIIDVTPGATLQAGMWVYSQGSGDTFRVVLRDLADKLIHPDAFDEQTIPGNTWTFFSIEDIPVPLDVDEVIFRIGHTGTGDPGRVFVALPYVREGLPAATVGKIWGDVYDDATIDHPTRTAAGSGAWWDGTRRYLEYDFDDVNDSNGVAWADAEVSLKLKRGQNYLKILSQFAELGYEWRIVPKQLLSANPADDGVWVLRIFNPGTAGVDRTGDLMPLIHEYTRAGIRQFGPSATRFTVEGDFEQSARAINADADAAIGHIERYESDRALGAMQEVDNAAAFMLAQSIDRTQSLNPVISPGPDDSQPLVDFTVGDSVNVQTRSLNDAVEVTTQGRRIISITTANSPIEGTTYQLALGSESFVGVNSFYEGVRVLLDEFAALEEFGPDTGSGERQALEVSAGGGAGWTVRVAASDALPYEKEVADFVCDGVNDAATIVEAFDTLLEATDAGGIIWFSTGTFTINMSNGGIALSGGQGGMIIRGSGRDQTYFRLTGEPPNNNFFLFDIADPFVTIEDFTMTDWTNLTTFAPNGIRVESNSHIRNVYMDYIGGNGIWLRGADTVIENCYLFGGFGLSTHDYDATVGIYQQYGGTGTYRHNTIGWIGRGMMLPFQVAPTIDGNRFQADGHHIYIEGSSGSAYGRKLSITNNRFDNGRCAIIRPRVSNTGPFDSGQTANFENGWVITGNTFANCNNNSVGGFPQNPNLATLEGCIDLAVTASLTISNNYFSNNHQNDIILRRYAQYPLNPQGTVISDNTLTSINAEDTQSSILVLNEVAGPIGGLDIHDNVWYMTGERWGVEFQSVGGGVFTNCKIHDNIMKYDGSGGILVHNMVDSIIEANQIADMTYGGDQGAFDRSGTEVWGIISLDSCREMVVRGNFATSAIVFARSGTTSAIELYNNCADVLVEGNVYKEDVESEGSTIALDHGLIVRAGCTDIRAIGNDFRAATSRFLDPGAVLVLTYTGGAGIGDNW